LRLGNFCIVFIIDLRELALIKAGLGSPNLRDLSD
jgi:hypothetical protein